MASTVTAEAAATAANTAEKNAERIFAYIDLAIALSLSKWAALTTAVQNNWGGPESSEKRDWLAGVLSDLFRERPETDEEDVEDVLCQVMADEFDVQLEDGSEIAVAAEICKLRRHCLDGDVAGVEELKRQWEARKGRQALISQSGGAEDSDGDEGDDGDDMDVDMQDDAQQQGPTSIPARERPPPEVDDDGFTKVVGRRKR